MPPKPAGKKPSERFTRIVRELREEQAAEAALRISLAREIAESEGRDQRITRALMALDPVAKAEAKLAAKAKPSARKTPPQRKPKAKASRDPNTWQPTEKLLAKAKAVLPDLVEPWSTIDLAKRAGMSPGAARNIVRVLRADDLIRLVGKRGGGR